ncbi:hypothetical protein [Tardiphaga sp.]|uniref:hypothetical protein n=1 Tax=Tardiphaga sp. TaxID=1926292 RepID=UPI002630AD26|nr:hypothetical protein [Tardiphaga sp.]MDB5616219.1 hypothetical protein [Tardiphaga sp.]
MDPITLALLGGAATGVGSWLNGSAQDKVNAARDKVTQDERARQQALSGEADKINDGSIGRYGNFDTQLADKSSQLASFFKTPVTTPTTPNTVAALPPTSGGIVDREIADKTGIADAYVNHQADSLGNLRSFGDLFGGIQRSQAHDATMVGQLGGFKRASSGVEALELDNANRAGNSQKMWADITTGLGKVGLTAALAGHYQPDAIINADGSIDGAIGPTSVGGKPLVGQVDGAVGPTSLGGRVLMGQSTKLGSNTTPFLTYGR